MNKDVLEFLYSSDNEDIRDKLLELSDLENKLNLIEDSINNINCKLHALKTYIKYSSLYMENYKDLLSSRKILYNKLCDVEESIMRKKMEAYLLIFNGELGEMFTFINKAYLPISLLENNGQRMLNKKGRE